MEFALPKKNVHYLYLNFEMNWSVLMNGPTLTCKKKEIQIVSHNFCSGFACAHSSLNRKEMKNPNDLKLYHLYKLHEKTLV